MEYKVCIEGGRAEFEDACGRLLAAGWMPQGGIAVYRHPGDMLLKFYQAFTRGKGPIQKG